MGRSFKGIEIDLLKYIYILKFIKIQRTSINLRNTIIKWMA